MRPSATIQVTRMEAKRDELFRLEAHLSVHLEGSLWEEAAPISTASLFWVQGELERAVGAEPFPRLILRSFFSIHLHCRRRRVRELELGRQACWCEYRHRCVKHSLGGEHERPSRSSRQNESASWLS